ncbi:hypothetical protein CYMTET_54641 [Cymbomonas tetramitiformis]|uniref:Calcium-activated potassium channel BK alpha subunit domain-containing protein n=1 Tax=Cymbomonas tetramitiformis TaxID=36881 RepID=A0AAE0BFP6_9CHLO|nr:hypothetical protein CYMTET_54641 [Cymbomonas tetramitiformis]
MHLILGAESPSFLVAGSFGNKTLQHRRARGFAARGFHCELKSFRSKAQSRGSCSIFCCQRWVDVAVLPREQVYPSLNFRLVLLRPQSRLLANKFKIFPEWCYSVYELKANLLAQSVRCPGVSTWLLGLGHNCKEADPKLEEAHPWMSAFNAGTEHQVWGAQLLDEYDNMVFGDAAKRIYDYSGALLIACRTQGQLMVNPHGMRLGPGAIVYLIAKSNTQLSRVAVPGDGGMGMGGWGQGGWVDEWMVDEWVGWVGGRVDEWMGDEWMSGWGMGDMDGWRWGGWLDEWNLIYERSLTAIQPRGMRRLPSAVSNTVEQSKQLLMSLKHDSDRVVPMCRDRPHNSAPAENSGEDSGPLSESTEKSESMERKVTNLRDRGRQTKSRPNPRKTSRLSSRFRAATSMSSVKNQQGGAEEDPSQEMAAQKTILPAVLQQHAGHIVILGMGELLLQQLEALIKPLRDPWLLVWTEIVVVSTQPMDRFLDAFEARPLTAPRPAPSHSPAAWGCSAASCGALIGGRVAGEELCGPGTHSPMLVVEIRQGVYVICGSPIRHQALSLAGVEDACKVVILDSSVVKSPTISDYNTVMVYGVLDSYLEWKGATGVSVFTALNTIDSIKQLAMNSNLVVMVHPSECPRHSHSHSPHPAKRKSSEWTRGNSNLSLQATREQLKVVKGRSRKFMLAFGPSVPPAVFPPHMHPQFVSGCSMAIADLVSWFGQSYHTPGYMELMEALLLPSEVRKARMGWHVSMVWMMSPKKVQRCKTWGTLVEFCMAGGAIPMALSRYIGEDEHVADSSEAGEGETSKDRYIITNPPPDCVLIPESDEAMVLAPPRWAYANCIDAQIVELLAVARHTRLLRTALQEWRAMVRHGVSGNRTYWHAEELRNASDTSDDETSGQGVLIDTGDEVCVTSTNDTKETTSVNAIREQLLKEIDKQHDSLRAMIMTALPT